MEAMVVGMTSKSLILSSLISSSSSALPLLPPRLRLNPNPKPSPFIAFSLQPPFPVPSASHLAFLSSVALASSATTPRRALALADEALLDGGPPSLPDISSVAETLQNGAIGFLFVAAFVGLTVLTAGVIYLAVSDFMEKKQREEETKAVGKSSEKKRTKEEQVKTVRSGPRGFGKKFQDEE